LGSDSFITPAGHEATEPSRLPSLPQSVSRIDLLPEDFFKLLTHKPLLIGDVIAGRYKLVQHLGDGGMGQVWIAENLSIGAKVALKVLKVELLADAEFRKRFQREAEAIAAINHRNVVRFLDLVVGDPTVLVMEYVPGRTLAALLKDEERIDPIRAVHLTIRLCWALEAAHKAGIVHRDLSPGNVLLQPDAEHGEEPTLIDFGLAKLATARPEDQLTRKGQIIGTPAYMSPEQIRNKEVDGRSDMYSLGCLLFHMLAGRPPFVGDEMQVLYQHAHRPPPQLGGDPILNDVLARALAKEPDARYRDISELRQALSRIDRPPTAPAPRPPRHSAMWAAAGLLGMLLGAAAVRWLAPGPGGGAIVILSQPPGATVEIDGHRLGETTPTLAAGMSAGSHIVRLRRDGYGPVEKTVQLASGERVAVDVALAAQSRELEVQSLPVGALVYLDGHLVVGQTPLVVELTRDDFHELRLEKVGYEPVRRDLKPEDSAPKLSFQLEPEQQPRGVLWVDGNSAAQVFLDGANTGFATPTLGIRVAAGDHTVELRDAAGRVGAVTRVHLERGETRHLTLDFASRTEK
jgi:hypothetical protein